MRTFYLTCVIAIGFCSFALSQTLDNPYRTFYQPSNYHWTDSLPWSSVVNVKDVTGLLETTSKADSFVVNIAVYDQKAEEISSSGGGVLYFPAGEYYFEDDLELHSNVIIRGADSDNPLAKTASFAPPSKFIFPGYLPGTERSSAFKEVTADTLGIVNSGMVNIDLNRAIIGIYGGGWTKNLNGKTYEKYQAEYLSSNILIMGVRHNNAAIPDPSSPSANQMGFGATANSQAWPWRFGNNIDINVSQNCVVVNCRLNDNPTDNFLQPNYILNDNASIPDVSNTEFNYLHHSGIDVNRSKVLTRGNGYYAAGPHGKHGLEGFVTYATPETEPILFRPGIEIRDNWVKTLTRVKIKAAGIGLVIDNNICTDDGGKIYYFTEDGTKIQTNNSATYENRGIDFSGWNCKVTRNNIFIRQGNIRNKYISIDGEGILVQECCGGTAVNDYYIADNTLATQSSGYIGLWKMRDFNNVVITRNNLGNKAIYALADVNGCGNVPSPPCYKMNGVLIDSNYNVSHIDIKGSAGGSGCNNIISRNKFIPATGTTGNNNVAIVSRANFTLMDDNDFSNRILKLSPALTASTDASGRLTLPTKDTLISSCPQDSLLFAVEIDCGTVDSVIFYKNSSLGTARIGAGQLANNRYQFKMNLPALSSNIAVFEYVTARVFSGGGLGAQWTNTVEIRKECELSTVISPPTGIADEQVRNKTIMYPNPATGNLFIKNIKSGENIQIFNSLGQLIISQSLINEQNSINISSLLPGIYLVRVGGRFSDRLIKN